MEIENQNNNVVKVSDWFVTMIVVSIPIIGFIMLFVWAFSGGTNPSKANWAKAILLFMVIMMILSIGIVVIFGAGIAGLAAMQK